jgi:phage terminase large subunit-like protein
MPGVDAATRARAMLALRERERRRRLGPKYDWYGDECVCGVPLGECREHHRARPEQRPAGFPRATSGRTDWDVVLFESGRGWGKTRAGAEFVRHQVERGAWGHVALINETVKDVRDVMIEGPGGLLDIAPPWFRPIYEPSKARVTWPNGAYATIFSAEQPGLLRGPQFHGGWLDEIAKWKHAQQETWDMFSFGLRLGAHPQAIITTTPRPTPTYKKIRAHARTVRSGGSTYENRAHLASTFFDKVTSDYANTRLGRQELEAQLLEDVPGALWTHEIIERSRRPGGVPYPHTLKRVVVGVDPAAGSNDPESGAETGIVVAGLASDDQCYVLEDASVKGSPEEWARAVLSAYERHAADRIVAEKNNGGDMVAHVITSAPGGRNAPVALVWATRGSELRAEPVALLYESDRIHHVGRLDALEDQMTGYVPGLPKKQQPNRIDRLDALVWCCSELMLGAGPQTGQCVTGGDRPTYASAIGV